MKSLIELRREHKVKIDEARAIMTTADNEKRALNDDEGTNFDALMSEVDAMEQSIMTEERRLMLARGHAEPIDPVAKLDGTRRGYVGNEERGKLLRATNDRENRSVEITDTGVLLPSYQASDIKPTFNVVSSLIDRVGVKMLQGGDTFKQAYVDTYGTGGYTDEKGTPPTAEPTFGYATVSRTKIGAYAEDTEELLKLPLADYDAEVVRGITIALRRKITAEILIGDGETGHFVGIFDNGATAINSATDKTASEIDEDFLDDLIFSYGGDENVEDAGVLILNKLDLKAIAMLRDADGKRIYSVNPTGNTGTIDGIIPYIINSNCKAISATATTSGQYSMAYGPLSAYTMAIFSPMSVARSTDYKFKEGMIAHRGVIFAGGNVTMKNGFLRVKKG